MIVIFLHHFLVTSMSQRCMRFVRKRSVLSFESRWWNARTIAKRCCCHRYGINCIWSHISACTGKTQTTNDRSLCWMHQIIDETNRSSTIRMFSIVSIREIYLFFTISDSSEYFWCTIDFVQIDGWTKSKNGWRCITKIIGYTRCFVFVVSQSAITMCSRRSTRSIIASCQWSTGKINILLYY